MVKKIATTIKENKFLILATTKVPFNGLFQIHYKIVIICKAFLLL
ncbi:hypothetical protein SAMN05216324_11464 [Chryseobacterium limigenitum]|uniref:Uncharacterized protein n=1 Tax=Chryseobacterium limigenitum TaxID=1612149 RepID=A0A1K2IW23_9FLAO|nr:hypothetical protein SAMN05216324_11464 [Chryseobacterium limigenitum]